MYVYGQVIVHDKGKAGGGPSNSFSKATFVAQGEGATATVELNDPDFWTKVVGLSMPEVEEIKLGQSSIHSFSQSILFFLVKCNVPA